jgi:hypothetical protein
MTSHPPSAQIDSELSCFPDHPLHVGSAAHELLPAVALARPDHDLGDVAAAREAGDGVGRVVVV